MDEAYKQLRSVIATRTRRIIFWCGAGLSAPAGIPTWQALQRKLEAALSEKLISLNFTHAQREAKVRSIRQEASPWIAFHRLHGELGATTFRETIRSALSKSSVAEVPPAYCAIWRIRPFGLINLNLDRLATRASSEAGVKGLIEFKGKEVGSYSYTLGEPRPFICNIHGVEEDAESWVFTQASLKSLADSEAYKQYIASIFTTSTVVFLGITADDVAVGGHLERMVAVGIRPQTHYWFTDRHDPLTDAWAEKSGIRVIRYKPTSVTHPELVEMLDDLATYVQPEEGESDPVALEIDYGPVNIPTQDLLVTYPPESIRAQLNAYAADLLKHEEVDGRAKYEEFSKNYDRAIHNAWYTSTEPGDNNFLGYQLVEEVARGAFGLVFRAINDRGEEFAIKVLHAEIRRKSELLNAFRRGAKSMKILEEHSVAGVVKYHGASEIPATLIMDWIEGPNLNGVVESSTLDDWERILEIAVQLTDVIVAAHSLPERVLHRDVRPANIMVSGYWEDDPLDVKVLDFDLSWHRGSVEKSVIFGSQMSGYLAPEQIQRTPGVSTQHASVDSYGIGMTIFYMVSGRNPVPGEHAHSNWQATLESASSRPRGAAWKSLPRRIARLIGSATQGQQSKRWDVSQIQAELTRLRDALRTETTPSAELVAEEVASRCALLRNYKWNDETFSLECDYGTGLSVRVSGNESSQDIVVMLVRHANEATDRNRLGDVINRARDSVRAALQSGNWDVDADIGHGMLTVRATLPMPVAVSDMTGAADALNRAIERMAFN